jgi:predicted porin
MKRNILTLAVAAGLIASAGVASADPTLYGRVHLALETASDSEKAGLSGVKEDTDMNSRKSVIGVKGTEDLGNGLKAFYKMEWEVDPADSGVGGKGKNLDGRDQFAGLKGGWGKALFGTASSNYKQMGSKIDPFWHHAAEGRGYTNTMSKYHGSKGTDRGRMTNMLQYTTPKMAGIEVVLNYTLNGATTGTTGAPINCASSVGAGSLPADPATVPGATSLKDLGVSSLSGIGSGLCGGDETLGAGIRWSNKDFLVYFDYLDPDEYGIGPINSDNYTPADESIMKIGGKWSAKQFWISAQYEMAEDQTGGDYAFIAGNFDINKNNAIAATYGMHDNLSNGYAIGYTHKMSKQTKVYVDYSALNDDLNDTPAGYEKFDDSVIALGFVKSF